jgi:hypothetical protein
MVTLPPDIMGNGHVTPGNPGTPVTRSLLGAPPHATGFFLFFITLAKVLKSPLCLEKSDTRDYEP